MSNDTASLRGGAVGPLSLSMCSLAGGSATHLTGGTPKQPPNPNSCTPSQTPFSTNSLNRRSNKRVADSEVRRSWGAFDRGEDGADLWACISDNYNFIMGTQLVPDNCQLVTPGEAPAAVSIGQDLELSWDPCDVSPQYVWSVCEFLQQYNELYEWLLQVQLRLYSNANPPDKDTRMAQHEALKGLAYRRNLFVQQGSQVAARNPHAADDIAWRVNHLSSKWTQLEATCVPPKGNVTVEVQIDLEQEESAVRGWLQEVESQIQPLTCTLPKGCSISSLQDAQRRNQILLKDIEAHGPVLKSVLRQYERIAAEATAVTPTLTSTSTQSIPTPSLTPLGPKPLRKRAQRKARSLEKRWHQVYLRCLEWYYYLEGVILNFKEKDSSSSESDNEPLSKCRRLSYNTTVLTNKLLCHSSGESSIESYSIAPRRRRVRGRVRPRGLSDSEHVSEVGSYIEDDYVYVSDGETVQPSAKRASPDAPSSVVPGSDHQPEVMVGVEAVMAPLQEAGDPPTLQTDSVIQLQVNNENNLNGNLQAQEYPPLQKESHTAGGATRVSPAKSCMTAVQRPSPNCAIFDFKHDDSDPQEAPHNTNANEAIALTIQPKTVLRRRTKRHSSRRFIPRAENLSCDDEVDHEALQQIIDSAILDSDWLASSLPSSEGEDVPVGENESANERMEIDSSDSNKEHPEGEVTSATGPTSMSKSCSKECITRLVSGAEQLVRESPVAATPLSPRDSLQPLHLGAQVSTKQTRVRQWLMKQRNEAAQMHDSCDASGEQSSGESEAEAFNEADENDKQGGKDVASSSENTTNEKAIGGQVVPTVILRGRKRRQNDQRPWSLTELHHKFLLGSSKDAEEAMQSAGLEPGNTPITALSTSESALQHLALSPGTPGTPTNQESTQSDGTLLNTPVCDTLCPFPLPLLPSSSAFPTPSTPSDTFNASSTSFPSPNTAAPPLQVSPLPPGVIRKRRAKLRKKSTYSLGRRTDSGSDVTPLVPSSTGPTPSSPSPLPFSTLSRTPPPLSSHKHHSSESEDTCAKGMVKSSSFSGGFRSGEPMTSSTERCLSEGLPQASSSGEEEASSPCLLSPPLPPMPPTPLSARSRLTSDVDASNTHEDMSSLSEQAWDPYQDLKYLSEPYSEDIDQDAARQLLDFGDDYRKYIDSDGASSSMIGRRRPGALGGNSPHHIRRGRHALPRGDCDSDSECDELHHVTQQSKIQVTQLQAALKACQGETALEMDYCELLTTAQTNLRCLSEILRHLHWEGTSPNSAQYKYITGIMQRWEALQAEAQQRQRNNAQLRSLQKELRAQRLGLEEANARLDEVVANVEGSELQHRLKLAQDIFTDVDCRRGDLSALTVSTHRLLTDAGLSSAAIKDDVAELYRLWDEVHKRCGSEVSSLEAALDTWQQWQQHKEALEQVLQQDSQTLKVLDEALESGGNPPEALSVSVLNVASLLNQRRANASRTLSVSKTQVMSASGRKDLHLRPEGGAVEGSQECLSDSGTSGYESCSSDDLSERERRLEHLRRLARQLEAALAPGSQDWQEVQKFVMEAENELRELQKHCRELVVRSTGTLQSQHKQYSGISCGRSTDPLSNLMCSTPPSPTTVSPGAGSPAGRSSWIRRVLRASVPFQAALLLMLCVACLLEPHCCDSLNSLNMSLTPQLRFSPSSPPPL